MNTKRLMLGNEALAYGLLKNGCQMACAYPGTPSSEILSAVVSLKKEMDLNIHAQWAVNEKVAFETAYAGAQAGLRTAVAMKQVGLNVAADPLMSSVYLGVKGGFIVISADDPGPHSSQTEQDSRLMAVMAKLPVLDPDSPGQAAELAGIAFELSEAFEIPVMLRPTTRVCHSRQSMDVKKIEMTLRQAAFEKNPGRWAATPKFRLQLHKELEAKLAKIADYEPTRPRLVSGTAAGTGQAIVVAGVAAANARDIIKEKNLDIPVYQVVQAFPLHKAFIDEMDAYDDILVLEETWGVVEMQLADKKRVKGKNTGFISPVGELLPENVEERICAFAGLDYQAPQITMLPGRRPTLCAGCPHRASFYAIKKVAPKGIFTSDIGCYTLGCNLGAVDTVTCMGAGISQAAGFTIAYTENEKQPPVFSTIGDSTFFHSGIPGLIETVTKKIPYVLVILDNRTTAMTGHQPTPASGRDAAGDPCIAVNIPDIVKGCGVNFIKTADPYDLPAFIDILKEAKAYCQENGPAVVIAEHPCLLDMDRAELKASFKKVVVNRDVCDGCGYCVSRFECPALSMDQETEQVRIDPGLCTGCAVCSFVCPKGALVLENQE
ncbi:thiamine pyrophosphate-dependent enzyme [Desulfobacter latus]|uniref:Indolepyruvate oxidoreductase subunit IorA n=1 Tax=Desulfobacter latus TaxID=2292 RepID=A0A850SRI2_9BACT|nr:thiamine pyrophosphate-dependent enzyme [Desulfobacter latus]NWH04044.1 4Fe-4S binding protein [Desulfobacter latus]